jgi:predicted nucleic acid-binding Zn ribbon protein
MSPKKNRWTTRQIVMAVIGILIVLSMILPSLTIFF